MRILGCDYSTHYVDFVTIEDDRPPCWDRFPLHGTDSFERARSVAGNIPGQAYAYWDDVLAVGIEEPAGRNTGHMFRIQGAILACIPARMLVEKWMPSQWRKAVGVPGNASKDSVRVYARHHLYIDHEMTVPEWPQDACDAYCVAVATRQAIREGEAAA